MSEENPYAAPSVNPLGDHVVENSRIRLDRVDLVKAEAIIKDASQFWLAIILCFLCTAIGCIIVPIWYAFRLLQWNRIAKKYPDLMAADVPAKSFQAKFQSSQWKLITGLVFGCLILALISLSLVSVFFGVSI